MDSCDYPADDAYKVMCRFPSLSCSESFDKWSGFISTTLGKTIRLSISVPHFPDTEGIQLAKDKLDEKAIQYWEPLMKQVPVDQCNSFLEYLQLLESLVIGEGTSEGASGPSEKNLNIPDLYSKIIEEIEAIGIKNVVSLSKDFKKITIKCLDKFERTHYLKLTINPGYPKTAPTVEVDLPLSSDSIKWESSIVEISSMFGKLVDKCLHFWNDMEDLDSLVRVVDPVPSNKGHYHRRILLEESVIVHLVFNALAPRALPQISFAGPEKLVDEFNKALDKDFNLWDEEMTVLQNLKSILNCEFIMKECPYGREQDNVEEEQAPCTVCYAFNFEDEIPDIGCDCGAVYHRQCLNDLFVNNVTTAVMRAFVECPACQLQIRVPPKRTKW